MRLPRFPGLPVSRRRHEALKAEARYAQVQASEVLGPHVQEARRHRDEARARVAELEQAIRTFCDRTKPVASPTEVLNAAAKLRAVLDGHDRQEHADGPSECTCERFIRESFGAHWESCPSLGGQR